LRTHLERGLRVMQLAPGSAVTMTASEAAPI